MESAVGPSFVVHQAILRKFDAEEHCVGAKVVVCSKLKRVFKVAQIQLEEATGLRSCRLYDVDCQLKSPKMSYRHEHRPICF